MVSPPPTSYSSEGSSCFTTTDTKTLGGAGFASQCTTFHPRLCFPSPPSRGLYLTLRRPPAIPDSQPTSFVLSLKNDEPEDRENGRRGSVMHYEWSFDVRAQAEGVFTIEAEWKDFKGTFRGREDKEAPNLDPTSIYEYVVGRRSLARVAMCADILSQAVVHVSE